MASHHQKHPITIGSLRYHRLTFKPARTEIKTERAYRCSLSRRLIVHVYIVLVGGAIPPAGPGRAERRREGPPGPGQAGLSSPPRIQLSLTPPLPPPPHPPPPRLVPPTAAARAVGHPRGSCCCSPSLADTGYGSGRARLSEAEQFNVLGRARPLHFEPTDHLKIQSPIFYPEQVFNSIYRTPSPRHMYACVIV